MPKKKPPVRLPKEFKRYFWDMRFYEIASVPFSKFVLERLMNFGDLKVLKWLLRKAPSDKIKEVVDEGRELDVKTRNFWRAVYGK